MRIHKIWGEVVAEPSGQNLLAGEHKVVWDGKDIDGKSTPTGVYFYQIKSGDDSRARKMVLLE